jgi:hypothetical protein
MATEMEQARDAQSNKTWIRSLIALGALFALGTAWLIYFGTVVKPADDKHKDIVACQSYIKGYNAAKSAFMNEAMATDHAPSVATAITNYLKELQTGYNRAYNGAAKDGSVQNAMVAISTQRLQVDESSEAGLKAGFSNVDAAAQQAGSVCNTILDNANVKIPTIAPSTK